MNVIFGSRDRGRLEALRGSYRRLYGGDPDVDGNMVMARDGVVIGVSSRPGVQMAVLGEVHDPSSGRRYRDPDDAAAALLDRYLLKGREFAEGVDGHFAAFVDDGESGRMTIAVSPGSHNGVFLHRAGGVVTWSTALYLLATAVGASVDRSWEDFMLLYGFYPYGRTPFAGISEIRPGQMVEIHEGEVTTRELPDSDPWEGEYLDGLAEADDDTASDLLHRAFMRALEEQVPVGEPVAVLLGGFDSALVASGLKRLGVEVETFTFRYGSEAYNQPHVESLSRYLGVRHHWVTIEPEDIARGLEDYALNFNTLTNWPNYVIQTRAVAEQVRAAGFSYVFSGDGCDYLFFGYPLTYRRNQVINAVPRIPRPVHRGLVALMSRPGLDRWLGRPYQVGMGAIRAWGRRQPTRSHLSFKVFDEVSLSNLRVGSPPRQERDIESVIQDLASPFDGLDPTRIAYLGKLFLAPYRIKMAGSSQATGVSITTPYLHRGMKEFALNLPPSLLRPDNDDKTKVIGKYALALMAERHELLPSEIIYQDKMGAVDAPLVDWYAGPLRRTLQSLFRHLPFPADDRYLRRLITPKRAEAAYARLISKDTSNVVSISHGASILATYASMTMPRL